MLDSDTRQQLIEALDALPIDQQHRVVEFAKSLRDESRTPSWDERLAGVFGSLNTEQAEEMMRAIEPRGKPAKIKNLPKPRR